MNAYPTYTIATKYGELCVTFTGERRFDVHDSEAPNGRRVVYMPGASVTTPEGKPLVVNGIEYTTRDWVVFGAHWQKDAVVTDWHHSPGEYPYTRRKSGFGGFTADPTDKARSAVWDLCLAAATQAHNENPSAITLAEVVRLEEEAAKADAKANDLEVEAACLRNDADQFRIRANELAAPTLLTVI